MTLKICALAAALVLVAVTVAWCLLSARKSVRIARNEYVELRLIFNPDLYLPVAMGMIEAGTTPGSADAELSAAMGELQSLLSFQDQQHKDIASHEEEEGTYLRALQADMRQVAALLRIRAGEADVGGALAGLKAAQVQLKRLATEMDETIASSQLASSRTLRATLIALDMVSCAMIVATVLVNIGLYRSVIVPIRRLRDTVRMPASGRFDQRLPLTNDDEFGQLTRDFNRMAAELDDLYHDLERRVREKSRELVRSERLAGVGYLARISCGAVRAAEDAIAQVEQNPCDVVMLDLNLPCMDGLRCFEIIRERWPATSAVILTGFGTLEAAQRAICLGVVEFLTKPASLGDIERALHRAWRARFEVSDKDARNILPIALEEAGDAIQHDSPRTMNEIEHEYITAALERNGGNRAAAAAELGMSARKLYYRLSEYRRIDAHSAEARIRGT